MNEGRLRRAGSIAARGAEALLARVSGRTAERWQRSRGLIPVLMYHRVRPDDAEVSGIEPGMFVRASTFDRHVRWLSQRFELITLAEALDARREDAERPIAVITFDDGWRDNLTEAWPILERYHARATIFLVADWIAGRGPAAGEFLSPDEVRSLSDRGIEMGAHTMSHPRLDEISPDRIELELSASKAAAQSFTGRPCETFAYPYGRFAESAVAAAARHFRGAVVVGGGWWKTGQPLATIPRISIHDDMTRFIPMFEACLTRSL